MPLPDEQITRQNLWWREAGWEERDPHLDELRRQPRVFPVDPLAEVDLRKPGVHVVRGPRQVGKSTALKQLVHSSLAGGADPRSLIYLALDLLEGRPHEELYTSVTRAKELAGSDGACRLLLDEITMVPRWQTAVKSLWDDGVIRDDTVLCTGSSAIDLRHGTSERLPGRRGAGDDVLVLPQSMASVARALDSSIPASPELDIAALAAPEGQDLLRSMQVHLPALNRALELYTRFGGLPAAVAELLSGATEPSRDVKRIVHDSLIKEITSRGASQPAAHALLERIVRSLSSKTSWSRLAREMDTPLGSRAHQRATSSHVTVREYIELLADGYFVLVLYFWRSGSHSNALSNDKKLYFFDPLLHAVARDFAPGLPWNASALVENVLATHLLRRHEPKDQLLETPAEPQRLHAWATRGGEIDFVCGGWGDRAALEVKFANTVQPRVGANLARAHPGRPALIASKDSLVTDRPDHLVAPAALIAWALGT